MVQRCRARCNDAFAAAGCILHAFSRHGGLSVCLKQTQAIQMLLINVLHTLCSGTWALPLLLMHDHNAVADQTEQQSNDPKLHKHICVSVGAGSPVDNAPVMQGFYSLGHAEEAVLDIVTCLLPAPTISQPFLHCQVTL